MDLQQVSGIAGGNKIKKMLWNIYLF